MASFFAPVAGKNDFSSTKSNSSKAIEIATWAFVALAVVVLAVGVSYSITRGPHNEVVPTAGATTQPTSLPTVATELAPPATAPVTAPPAPSTTTAPTTDVPAPSVPAAVNNSSAPITTTTFATRKVVPTPATTTTPVPVTAPPTTQAPPVTAPPVTTTPTTDQFGNGSGGNQGPIGGGGNGNSDSPLHNLLPGFDN